MRDEKRAGDLAADIVPQAGKHFLRFILRAKGLFKNNFGFFEL